MQNSLTKDSQALRQFLGTSRWIALKHAIIRNSSKPSVPLVGTLGVIIALLIAATPPILTILDVNSVPTSIPVPTLAFGVCTLLAIIIRWRLGLTDKGITSWKEAFSLTHTAFAFGCIPAVVILALNPHLFSIRHEYFIDATATPAEQISIVALAIFILSSSAWIAITEEFIFRGMLFSTLRRWEILKTQKHRDIFAITVSSIIFGFSHAALWGPVAAIALTGLGVGFVIGYMANNEAIVPVIIYHFLFDVLSISLLFIV